MVVRITNNDEELYICLYKSQRMCNVNFDNVS